MTATTLPLLSLFLLLQKQTSMVDFTYSHQFLRQPTSLTSIKSGFDCVYFYVWVIKDTVLRKFIELLREVAWHVFELWRPFWKWELKSIKCCINARAEQIDPTSLHSLNVIKGHSISGIWPCRWLGQSASSTSWLQAKVRYIIYHCKWIWQVR